MKNVIESIRVGMPSGCVSGVAIQSRSLIGPFYVHNVLWNTSLTISDDNAMFCWILLGTALTTSQFAQEEDNRSISEYWASGVGKVYNYGPSTPFLDNVGGVYVGRNQRLMILPYFSANTTVLGDVLVRITRA